jgi:hypothetical protein
MIALSLRAACEWRSSDAVPAVAKHALAERFAERRQAGVTGPFSM